ncbi:tetratricopeptide repeat protein, partial [bacterium]|nr:tetratricopeptide repeat protein [bacterium]
LPLLAALAASMAHGGEAIEVYARGDYAGVVKLLEPDHKAGKASIQQRLLLARAYLHLDRSSDGLAVLRSVLDSDRENPEANSLTGQVLHRTGKHHEAIQYLEHAYRLKQDPTTAAALGMCHHALGQNTKAKAYLEKALLQDIRNPTNSFVLGKICLERGLGALAEKYLLTAQEAGMESDELHLLLGRAYVLQRKLLGPVRERRIPAKPKLGDVVDSHLVVGAIEGVADRYQVCTRFSALYEGLHLLRSQPKNPDALYMATAGWLAIRQTDLARPHLAALRAAEPKSRRVAELQAELLLITRDYAGLEKHLDGAVAGKLFGPRDAADRLYRAAMALRADGKRDPAMRLLKKAEQHTPTAAKAPHSLAGLAMAANQSDAASGYFARMVELFPDAPDADEWRNILNTLRQNGAAQ